MKLLIVHHDHKTALRLKDYLEPRGYAVDILTKGQAGKDRLLVHRDDYDLVMIDHALTGPSGNRLCQELRQHGLSLPILILAETATEHEKIDLLTSCADDLITPPYTLAELEARVAALLRRPPTTLQSVLHSARGIITLNVRTHTVIVHDAQIMLTLKEFMLLEYFMRNPDVVITRDELQSHAWDFAAMTLSNTVDVHIKNLRKKLEATRTEATIETVRGVGYRFVG